MTKLKLYRTLSKIVINEKLPVTGATSHSKHPPQQNLSTLKLSFPGQFDNIQIDSEN